MDQGFESRHWSCRYSVSPTLHSSRPSRDRRFTRSPAPPSASDLQARLSQAFWACLLLPLPSARCWALERVPKTSSCHCWSSGGLESRGRPLLFYFAPSRGPRPALRNPTLCGPGPRSPASMLAIPDVCTKSCSAAPSDRFGLARTPSSMVPRHSRFWLDAWSRGPLSASRCCSISSHR